MLRNYIMEYLINLLLLYLSTNKFKILSTVTPMLIELIMKSFEKKQQPIIQNFYWFEYNDIKPLKPHYIDNQYIK